MRVIDLDAGGVRTAAVSPDGRYLATSGAGGWLSVLDWSTGATLRRLPLGAACDQLAFVAGGLVCAHNGTLRLERLDAGALAAELGVNFAGGVAVSADGKVMVATRIGPANKARLEKWALPTFHRQPGFDNLSPFRKLAFSPNGVYLAGIGSDLLGRQPSRFELRFAASAGLDRRYPDIGGPAFASAGFVSFARDSGLCAFGWENEFHVLDISTGTSRYLRNVAARFRDASFTGSGRLFATAEESGVLTMWDPIAWRPVREYDWGCGPLSCVTFTADGTAGVCGTADGRLVLFDVDE